MAKHLQREIEKLKKRILSIGGMVEDRLQKAIRAIDVKDVGVANNIIKTDFEIDEAEVEIEEECLKLLALYQPVAIDLRFIIASLKINNDLERIGDEAVNIAQRILILSKTEHNLVHFTYNEMAERSGFMMRKSIDSFVKLDLDLAFKVIKMDDEVDEMDYQIYNTVMDNIRHNPEHVEYLTNFLFISRHLERIADHATNIAEEVVYLIEGEIIRHGFFEHKA